jgi:hypothetical protein
VLPMVAIEVVSELHCTVSVTFCVLPSVKVPVAVNCMLVPRGMAGIAGVMAMLSRVAGLTVSVVEPMTDPSVAVTLVLPTAALAATPCAFSVAMLEFPVLQATDVVMSNVLPSV